MKNSDNSVCSGGFELGCERYSMFLTDRQTYHETSAPSIYDGGGIVGRSIDRGTPVIYVSMNYRVSGLGFMASKEIKAAGVGNLGLQDRKSCVALIFRFEDLLTTLIYANLFMQNDKHFVGFRNILANSVEILPK